MVTNSGIRLLSSSLVEVLLLLAPQESTDPGQDTTNWLLKNNKKKVSKLKKTLRMFPAQRSTCDWPNEPHGGGNLNFSAQSDFACARRRPVPVREVSLSLARKERARRNMCAVVVVNGASSARVWLISGGWPQPTPVNEAKNMWRTFGFSVKSAVRYFFF